MWLARSRNSTHSAALGTKPATGTVIPGSAPVVATRSAPALASRGRTSCVDLQPSPSAPVNSQTRSDSAAAAATTATRLAKTASRHGIRMGGMASEAAAQA